MTIDINNLIKKYDKKKVLDIPGLHINSSEIVGIVGNNGAGKTTLLRLLLDLAQATEGTVLSDGRDVSKTDAWKTYTGSFIEGNFLIDFLTPEEYFYFIGNIFKLSKETVNTRLLAYASFMNNEILNQKKYIRNFSAGNRQKTGIIGAMLTEPNVLILDEPFNFLDPTSQALIKKMIRELNERLDTTVFISSHNLNHITDISTRVVLLEKGKIIQDIDNTDKNAENTLNQYFNV